jgi:hypothetical protein
MADSRINTVSRGKWGIDDGVLSVKDLPRVVYVVIAFGLGEFNLRFFKESFAVLSSDFH